MPTRCCSPVDSSSGRVVLAAEQADLVERRAHALADLLLRHAGDDERQRDVVEDRAVVSSLWSWNTMPIWRRNAGIFERGTTRRCSGR